MDKKDTVVKKGVLLKDEQEKMQKKTFTKWMNSYLCQKKPPVIIKDLMKDLSDGLLLLDILEILTKTKLKKEKPKNMQRIHCLTNIKTALEFMENEKKIKMVNINPSDVVDGKPAIVLGLVWTSILHFQIEEQEEFLLQALGMANDPNANVKGQAKKGLMAWTNNALSDKYGLNIKDFGESWCDGRAFNALVHNIDPTLVDMEELEQRTNKERLENAFNIAENELGIPKLLDSEDVDVEKPDEKSIMTYVAQFLKSYPEGKKPENINEEITPEINDGLMSMIQPLNGLDVVKEFNDNVDKNFENLNSKNNYDIFADLMSQRDDMKLLLDKLSTENNTDLDANDVREALGDFNKTEMKLNEWQWDLDKILPGILGSEIGHWLQDAEESLMEPFPNVNDKAFDDKVLRKLKEHESIFNKKNDILAKFRDILKNPPTNISPKQLESMKNRIENVYKSEGVFREKLNIFGIQANLKNKSEKWERDLNSWDSPIQSKQDVFDRIEQFNISMENGTSMDKYTSQLSELIKRKMKFCKENPVLGEDLVNFINKAINECEEKNDELPERFESTRIKLENLSSEWDEISDGEQKIETFSRRLSKALQLDDLQQQRSLVDQLPEVLDLLNDVKCKIQNDLTPHCSEKLLNTMKENLNELEINLKELGDQVVDKVEKQKRKIEQQQAARDLLLNEIVSNGQANVDSIKQWMNELDQCIGTQINGSSKDLQDTLSKLNDLNKESPNIHKLIDQGYQKVDELENENSPEKAQELKESLDEFQKKFKKYTENEIPKNLQNLKTLFDTVKVVENDINDFQKIVKEVEIIKNHLDDSESLNGSDDITNKEQKFLDKENEISKSIAKDKDLLKNLKELAEDTNLKIDLKPLEKRIFDSEHVLQDLLTNAKENLVANNQCNEACKSADQSLEVLFDQIEKNSSINNDEEGQKTKLENIENIEEEMDEVEKLINAAVAQRNNYLPNLNKSNIDKIDNLISKMKQKTAGMKENLQKSKFNLSNNLNDWQDFKQTKEIMTKCFDDIINDLEESHHKRKGVHGQNLADKANLLEENKDRLENLIKQEEKLKDLNKKASKLGSQKPIADVQNLKDRILKQKEIIEKEISQNEKDLENHQQFNDDIQSFHDWLSQTEHLTNQIQNLPNTKEGLIEKQKLLEDLNSLKSSSDKKLKDLKTLQKIVLNETAPDEKENINIQLNKEIDKFNEIFVNLDKQDGINETIEKLENLGEKSDQVLEDMNEINKKLEKCLNLPSNTLNEKEKLGKELNNTIRLLDQQLAQINDLKSQCESLESCAAVEDLLNKLESLEEQCNEKKVEIEERINETESDLKKQTALEKNLKIFADLMNETDNEMKNSFSKQTEESAIEENLEKLKNLKSKLERGKKILEDVAEQKDDFNVPKNCLLACESSNKEYLDFKEEINQLEENLNVMKNNWSEFDSAKLQIEESLKTIDNNIENMHDTHNGIHGGDCDDKASLLEEKKNELDDLNRQEEEINNLSSKAKKLGSNSPMIEIQNLKERIHKQKENLEKEIKQNEKDLENHQQFNDDIQSFHDWLSQTEHLTNQIQNLPNTKEGLIEKQKLLEDLNSLKSTGDKKLKDLKNLQKIVLNETAPDEKENINIQLNKEIDKFNEIFINLDKQDGINETIEKLENLGERSDQVLEDMNEINKKLETCLNLPSNTLNEKKKLGKELNNTIRLLDQQLAQINDLKSQCESLESCAAVEELLNKLESLEEQCNENKVEIENKITENNINMKMQAALEEKLDEFTYLMNEAEIEITSLPKESSEIAIEESLQKLENIKSKHLPGKNILEGILKSKNEFKVPEEFSETCEKYEERYCNLESGIKDLTDALKQKKSDWSRYNSTKSDFEKFLETVKDDINNSHEMRKGIHGKSCRDKETIFDDNKKRLQHLNDKEKVTNELIGMAKLLGSEKTINEVLQLKKNFLKDKDDLEKEIKINEKDLENHRQYENDLDLFHDWIIEAEKVADKILGTPSTKTGLIEKQNLLDKLKNLKSTGDKKLKDLKTLQKIVLNETAPDEKENINIQLNKEIDKFNEIFINLDKQDGINETIEKLENLGEKSDQVLEDMNEINKKLEKCLNLPSNTLNEKEKLGKELNNTNRQLDQQLAQIDDLKSQCESLESCAAVEDLLNKLESLEEQCNEKKAEIDERIKENNSDIKFHSALEDKLTDLSELMNEVLIEFDYSKPKESSEAAVKESLSQLQKLKAQHEPGKYILEALIELRNEFNAPAQCVTACNDLEQKYFDIEDDIKNLQKELEMKTTIWQKYNALKADLDKTCNTSAFEIENEHKKRGGVHGRDCEDKFDLLEDKTKILSKLTDRDPQVNLLVETAGKLGFDKALYDAQNIKKKYMKQIDDLQQEISQNEIDLDNHRKLDQSLFSFEDWLKNTEKTVKQIANLPSDKNGLMEKQNRLEEMKILKSNGNEMIKNLKHLQNVVINETAADFKNTVNEKVKTEIEKFERVFGDLDQETDNIKETIGKLKLIDEKSNVIERNIREIENTINKCSIVPSESVGDKEKLGKLYKSLDQDIEQHLIDLNELKQKCNALEETTANLAMINKINKLTDECKSMKKDLSQLFSKAISDLKNLKAFQDKMNEFNDKMNRIEAEIEKCSPNGCNESAIKDNIKKLKKFRSLHENSKDVLTSILQIGHELSGLSQISEASDEAEQKYSDVEDEITKLESKLEMQKNEWSNFNSDKSDLEKWLNEITENVEKLEQVSDGMHAGKLSEKEKILDSHQKLLQEALNHEADINLFVDRSTPLLSAVNQDSPKRITNTLCKKYKKLLETLTNRIQHNEEDINLHENYAKQIDIFTDENNTIIKRMNEEIASLPNTKEGLQQKADLLGNLKDLYNQRKKILVNLENLKNVVIDHSSPSYYSNLEQQWDQIIDSFEKSFNPSIENQSKLLLAVQQIEKTESVCQDLQRQLENLERRLNDTMNQHISSLNDIEMKLETLKELRFESRELQTPINDLHRRYCQNPGEVELIQERIEQIAKQHKDLNESISENINETENHNKQLCNLTTSLNNFKTWLDYSSSQIEDKGKLGNLELNNLKKNLTSLKALKDDITEHKVDLSRLQSLVESLMRVTNDETFQKKLDEITKEYTVLCNKCQNEGDKCDHLIKLMTKYETSRADVLHWIEASTQTLLRCSDYTLKQSQMKSKLLMIENLEKDLENFGQSKFVEAIQDGEELLGELAGIPMQIVQQQIGDLKSDWVEISRQLNQLSSNLRNTTSRSETFKEMSNRLSNWLDDIEHTGLMDPSTIEHQCEIPFDTGSSSSKNDRAKTLLTELNRHKQDFIQLANLSAELANPSFDIENSQIQNRYNRLTNNLKDKIEKLNKQQADYDKVKQDIEEMEKWVFQTSIKIINENAEQGKTTTNTIQEIETLIQHSNEIISTILAQEPEITKIRQAVDSLINISSNQNSDKEKVLQDDLSKLVENFNNLKSASIHKQDHLKNSVKKWDNYQNFLQSTKMFLDNDLPRWWRERNQDQMKSSYSNFNNENILKEFLDMDNKLNGLKTIMELEAKECDGILPTIATTISRSQTPNFKSNRSLYSPSSNWSTNKSDINTNDDLVPNVLSKSIYEDLDDNIKKISNLKKEIMQKITDWNNFNREKTSFKNWLDNEMLKFSSVLYTEPGITNLASLQKSKLKLIQDEMNYKKPTLLNLNTRFNDLTSNVSGAADLVLKNINRDFEEAEKKIGKLLNREDKGVEADFTDEESNLDIIQELKVPKLNLLNLESPQLFRYESPDNLNRFTQTKIPKVETDYKFLKTNFGSQTPGTKTTQTYFNEMSNFGTQTNDKYQRNRERKLESGMKILNSLKNMNSEFERSKRDLEFSNDVPSIPMSAKPRSSTSESVRRNMYSANLPARQMSYSTSMQRIENDYKYHRPLSPVTHSQNVFNKRLSQISNPNLTKSFSDNLDNYIPTKNKWVDLEINTQPLNSSLKSYPIDNTIREFQIDYNAKFEGLPVSLRKRSPQRRRNSGSSKQNRSKSARNSRIAESINQINEDAKDLRILSQKLRSVK